MQTKELQDKLTGALIGLARATEGNAHMLTDSTAAVTAAGLGALNCEDPEILHQLLRQVDAEKQKLVPSCYICASPCGRTNNYDMGRLQKIPEDIRLLKFQILSDIRRIADSHTQPDRATADLLYLGLYAVGMEDWGMEELLPIAEKTAK